MSNEITVKLKCSVSEIDTILRNKGFKIIGRFFLDDTYFTQIESEKLNTLTSREILGKCVLIRNITEYQPHPYKVIKMTYKKKNIAENGEIISQQNINCEIKSVEEGKSFLEAIGYRELMNIKEKNTIYRNDELELSVKDIENGDKLIEIEIEQNDSNLNTTQKIKDLVKKIELPIEEENYFVKKTEIELNKIIRKD